MSLILALAAAIFFAVGTVLQQRVARTATEEEAASAGFLLRLARKPLWLAGIVADAGGFVCQAIALGIGRIVVVQPVLATSLVFALPLGAWLDGRRVTHREMWAAAAVTGGLAAFLVLADPSGGKPDASNAAWVVAFVVSGVLCAGAWVAARGASPMRRAVLLGCATGILFGLSAGLTKATVEELDDGILNVFEHWHVYALAVVGYVSMSLSQASLQTGALGAAVATQMALDPVTSVVLGTLAFDEQLHDTALGAIAALGGIAVMIGGIVALAVQSPAPAEAASLAEA